MGSHNKKQQKNITKEQIGTYSFLVTSTVFLLRGMWYFYYCGYFQAFNIDKSLLAINNDTSLYSVLGLIGIAIFLCVLNYWIYVLCIYKKWLWLVITVLVETIAMLFLICKMSDIGLEEVLECFRNTGWQGIWYIGRNCLFCVFLINIYGIIFYLVFRHADKKSNISTETTLDEIIKKFRTDDEKKIKTLLIIMIWTIVVSVALGNAVFLAGREDAKDKKDFRIIEEAHLEENHEVEDKYLFKENGQSPKQYYAVLYEMEDKYVVASLALEEGIVVKDLNRQKVISKENILTYYYADLEKDFWDKDKKQDVEIDVKIDKSNQEGKGNNNMIEAFGGAIVGALATGVVTLLIESRKRKKEERTIESHAASMLFYDLKSIEYYMAHESSSVNLRYTDDWQGIVASCSFLKGQHIQCIYKIYDEVYNYNYYYKLEERKGPVTKKNIPQYKEIQEILFDNSKGYINTEKYASMYEEIQDELKKHIS